MYVRDLRHQTASKAKKRIIEEAIKKKKNTSEMGKDHLNPDRNAGITARFRPRLEMCLIDLFGFHLSLYLKVSFHRLRVSSCGTVFSNFTAASRLFV